MSNLSFVFIFFSAELVVPTGFSQETAAAVLSIFGIII